MIFMGSVGWSVIAAGGVLAGIGFTMALFIANLAFDYSLIDAAKLGILADSLLCAALGFTLLVSQRPALSRPRRQH